MYRTSLAAVVIAVLLAAACGNDTEVGTGGDPPNQQYEVSTLVLENEEHGPQVCLGAVVDTYPPQCGGPDLVGFEWTDLPDRETDLGTIWGEAHLVGTYDGDTLALTEPPGPLEVVDGLADADFAPACDEPSVIHPDELLDQWDLAYLTLGEFHQAIVWVSDERLGWDGPFAVNAIVRPGAGDRTEAMIREHYGGPLCVVERDAPTARDLAKAQRELRDEESQLALGVVYLSGRVETRGVVTATVAVADDAAWSYAEGRWGDLVELSGLLQPVD